MVFVKDKDRSEPIKNLMAAWNLRRVCLGPAQVHSVQGHAVSFHSFEIGLFTAAEPER